MTVWSRRYSFPRREHSVHLRLNVVEYAELAAAAQLTGLATTGYVGEAALAADGRADTIGITRAELAQLQRDLFAARTVVNQAAASQRRTPAGPVLGDPTVACVRSVAELDAMVARIHRHLRQAADLPTGQRA